MSDGDNISLVDDSTVPENEKYRLKKLNITYELCRSEGEDTAKYEDGQILVQTTTEPILIPSDSDEEDSVAVQEKEVQPVQKKEVQPVQENGPAKKVVHFEEDYEIGEPSGIPRPPTPPKTDPVSKVRPFLNVFIYYFLKVFDIRKYGS